MSPLQFNTANGPSSSEQGVQLELLRSPGDKYAKICESYIMPTESPSALSSGCLAAQAGIGTLWVPGREPAIFDLDHNVYPLRVQNMVPRIDAGTQPLTDNNALWDRCGIAIRDNTLLIPLSVLETEMMASEALPARLEARALR